MPKIIRTIDQLVGDTPLVGLARYARKHNCQAKILAKLEYFNPTGSIKDRAALNMIKMAERLGKIRPGDTIVEQTGGNTGVALAAFAIPRGYQVEIFLERGASPERTLMLQAYGVKLLDYRDALGIKTEEERRAPWTDPDREATVEEIEAYCQAQPGRYFMHQAVNPYNPDAHIQTTGPEIWTTTRGAVDILVVAADTGGTLRGLSTYLRQRNPELKIVLVRPRNAAREDSQFTNEAPYDERIEIGQRDALNAARELISTEGLLAGASAARALCAATQVAQRPENAGKTIVVVMSDNSMKHLVAAARQPDLP